MLSIGVGTKIYGSLEDKCGGKVSVEVISKISNEKIRSTGTSSLKVVYIRNVTDVCISGTLNLKELTNISIR